MGRIFEVGASSRFYVETSGRLYLGVNDNFFGDNSGSWTAVVSVQRKRSDASMQPAAGQATIIKAMIQNGNTIQLPSGSLYLYGMVTGGGASSGEFVTGRTYRVVNATGQLAAAFGFSDGYRNSYSTQTDYHTIGGVSVGGAWRSFEIAHNANSRAGASDASVSFEVRTKSMIVVIGLASSQQEVSVTGIPGLQTDALSSGPLAAEGMIIAHAYLEPGRYIAVEHSSALARGQDPQHMADLIGVFVFGSR